MAAPLDVPVGYHIAMGAPLGLHASASSSPSAPHPDPPTPPAHQARRPDSYQRRRTAAMSASAWLRRTTAGTPGHCAIRTVEPPHRRSTSPPSRSAQGRSPSRLPSPALSSAQSSLRPLRPQRRFRRRLVREDAAARAARGRQSTPQLEQRPLGSRPLCFCPFLCPLANRRMRIRFGGHYLVHPRLYPQVRLDAAADFPFFRSKIGLRRPAVRLRSIVDPPEGRGCCCAL